MKLAFHISSAAFLHIIHFVRPIPGSSELSTLCVHHAPCTSDISVMKLVKVTV